MDSFRNTPNKINKLDKQSKNNEVELSKLTSNFTKSNVREYSNKISKTVYDSGWVTKNTGGILNNVSIYTPTKGNQSHLGISFNLSEDINISKDQLGFVKTAIMVKPTPEVNVRGLYVPSFGYVGIKHDGTLSSYHEIKGDSSPIYKGYNAIVKYRTEQQMLDGEFPENKTTKWWQGENDEAGEVFSLTFVSGGLSYRWHNATIDQLSCTWDVVDLGEGRFNSKGWRSTSFTDITGSTVSGYGVYIVNTWIEIAEDTWNLQTVKTYGFKSNVPIFQDTTSFHCFDGSLRYWNGSIWKAVTNNRTIQNSDTVTKFEFFESDFYMLHWHTNKLGAEVKIVQAGLDQLPDLDYFESPPYTNITHKINPYPYPSIQQIEELIYPSTFNIGWMKTGDEFIYKFKFSGGIVLTAPATDYIGDTQALLADTWDDVYASVGYPPNIAWDRTSQHTIKETEAYKPLDVDLQVRLLMTILPETDVVEVKQLNIKES